MNIFSQLPWHYFLIGLIFKVLRLNGFDLKKAAANTRHPKLFQELSFEYSEISENQNSFYQVSHNARKLIGNPDITVDRLQITLPDIGDLNFVSRSYELIGSRYESNSNLIKVWSGDLEKYFKGQEIDFLGDANFALAPNGDLACRIQVLHRGFLISMIYWMAYQTMSKDRYQI
jgi:hypothetical protein